MDLPVRIEILQCFYSYGSSPTATLRQFKLQRGLVKDPFPISLSSVTQLITNLGETDNIVDKTRCGYHTVDDDAVRIPLQAAGDTVKTRSIRGVVSVTTGKNIKRSSFRRSQLQY